MEGRKVETVSFMTDSLLKKRFESAIKRLGYTTFTQAFTEYMRDIVREDEKKNATRRLF